MYLSIPKVFNVPVYYAEDILNIKDVEILYDYNFPNYFMNKTTMRQEVKIGVSLPEGGGEGRWPKDKESLEKYARLNNATLILETDANDVAEQSEQVERLLSQGIDVLILVPIDLNASASIVEKAHNAGIKVIAYDRLILNADLNLYVSFNNVTIGELQGSYLTKKVPRGNYIILSGGSNDYNSKLVKDGAMSYIRPLANISNIKIVTEQVVDNWDPKLTYDIVKNSLIANNNRIDAILAPNDAMAGAAIKALEEQGLAGKVYVTGQNAELDAVKRIIRGTQSMTVFTDIREEAKIAIDAAIKLAKGQQITINATVYNGKIDVPSILIPPILVDLYNVNEVLINSGYYKLNEVFSL